MLSKNGEKSAYIFEGFDPNMHAAVVIDEFVFQDYHFEAWKVAVEGKVFNQFTKYVSGGTFMKINVPFIMCSNESPHEYIKNSKMNKHKAQSLLNRLAIIQTFRFEGDKLVDEIPDFNIEKEAIKIGIFQKSSNSNDSDDESCGVMINQSNENLNNTKVKFLKF